MHCSMGISISQCDLSGNLSEYIKDVVIASNCHNYSMIDQYETRGLRNAVEEAVLCFVGECYGKCTILVI